MAIRYNQLRRLKGFAVGSIVPWAGDISTVPAGWLACTGQTRQASDYPLLYRIIGNTYGGTVGSTFTLPSLLNGRGVTDIYQGHYAYLKTKGIAHYESASSTLASDPYWSSVGVDTNTSNSFSAQSEIDVVGAFVNPSNKPNLVANVTGITFEKGAFALTYSIHPRKLSDRHQATGTHTHGFVTSEVDSQNSFTVGGQRASTCSEGYTNTGRWGNSCKANNTGCHSPKTLGQRKVVSTANDCLVNGGSTGNTSGLGMLNNGDGFTGGSMYAAQVAGNNVRYASSLSNPEGKTWAQIGSHVHTHAGATFKCNVGVQSSYTFYDINSSGVSIVQPQGTEASININTETPSLTMLYIIKAF